MSTHSSAGDKVMQIENNYGNDVYNGDIGFVAGIDLDEQELSVSFDGRTVRYAFGELNELVLCYATTIHKSQGSEYPAVVIPLSTQHYIMLKRNLVYTGITRGKRLVVLVDQKRALAIALKGEQLERRWSKLEESLREPGSIRYRPESLRHLDCPRSGRVHQALESGQVVAHPAEHPEIVSARLPLLVLRLPSYLRRSGVGFISLAHCYNITALVGSAGLFFYRAILTLDGREPRDRIE